MREATVLPGCLPQGKTEADAPPGTRSPPHLWAACPSAAGSWLNTGSADSSGKDNMGFLRQAMQLLSHVQPSETPWTAARQAPLSITNSRSLFKLMSIESVIPSNCLILCHPLLLPPSIFSSLRVFFSQSVLHISWPQDWSFSFSISPSNEYSGLISFKMDWLDLLAVQGTVKSLLQHHSSKESILQLSTFFIVQLLHPYMTTGQTIASTRQTFIDKVMSLILICCLGWS